MAAKDFTGQTFGDFTVICRVITADKVHSYWRVSGPRGLERVVRSDRLPRLRVPRPSFRRGLCRIREYHIWYSMLRRCDAPTATGFEYYGGRGIAVCERWKTAENFLADMGPRPSPKHSIDRIDNDGNYEPGNCRWATMAEQNRNKRKRA